MRSHPTIRERIRACLEGTPAFRHFGTRPVMTASDITRFINPGGWSNFRYGPLPRVGLASVSSELRRLVSEGKLLRVDGFGPRGGYGYTKRHWNMPRTKRR